VLKITDTLGREVFFDYDANDNLQAIRQTWAGVVHYWATFNYGQVYVAPAFGGGLLINGPNNNYTTVLTQVNLHDGTYFTFQYNAAFAQVNRINEYAQDGHLLNYTSYNVNSSSGQTDCPRFTERRDWAENWNSGNEAVTTYSVASDGSWGQQTTPDGTIYKEFFATSGWQSGLTTTTEIWSGGVKKKWTTLAWTQDDTGVSFQKNARVSETNVYDAEGNRRRMTFTYYPTSSFSLPEDTYEYAADGVTVLRRTHLNYYLSSTYTDRRIIGLPSGRYVFDGNNTLYKFDVFDYDYGSELSATAQPAVQHDPAYGTSFTAGRGNLSLIRHVDVNNQASGWNSTVFGHNTTGSVTKIVDNLWRQTTFSYTDSFSDSVNRNTFAYPTTVTDPDGFQTLNKYKFEFGAVTWTQTPSPNVGQTAPTQDFTYDSVGRLQQITNNVNSAYVRWVYPTNSTTVQTYTTLVSGLGEAYSAEVFDGAGRVRATAADHPGSTGQYTGQYYVYNNMGQLVQHSNPTEMNSSWTPTGDDAAWVYTLQSYDWRGRPLVTTLPDGATRENTYGGCGCAGGEVTTVRDERGRRRKFTSDVLGRLKQIDELNWNQTVYATTTYTYNPLDQLTQINQGGQTRTFAYNGFGWLQSRTTPEQGTTSYSYFGDGLVQTMTDARGATTTYSYNNRLLVTGVTYGAPAGVAATPNVSFTYDAAGNRKTMTDGHGSVSYSYDQLSRLTSETRSFTGVGSFALSYAYNLGNELTSITNPWGAQVGYNYDKIGRPTSITGSGYSGVSSYISSLSYRAFGLKQANYSNGRTLSVQYDNRLRPTQWNIPGVMGWNYAYNYFNEKSSRVMYAQNINDGTLDRSFDYDHVGRLTASHSGVEARAHMGLVSSWTPDGPYAQRYYYDQWGNIVEREGWGGDNPAFTATYTNNKRNGLTYDASGNLTNDGGYNYSYGVTGQQATASATGYLLQQGYDGDGLRVKKTEGTTFYYLRSTLLGGQVVAEIAANGDWHRGYVYLGGELVAVQHAGVFWMHQDPVAKSKRVTNSSGTVVSTIELDPWGGNTNRNNNAAFQPRVFTTYERDSNAADEAMYRRYNRWWSRFDQPDPYDGSYDLTNPQSFNRYAYVQNDPVNFVDPTGLFAICGRGSLPPCEDEEPRRDPPTEEDLPRRPDDDTPRTLPILDNTNRRPVNPRPRKKLDPSNPVCVALQKKIDNIIKDQQKRADEILRNPQNLPLDGPGPDKTTINGHRRIMERQAQNLERRRKEYEDKCGSVGPPGGTPATQPSAQPAGNPAPNNPPVFIPIRPPVIPAPRPVVPSGPFFVPLPVIIIRCVVFRDCGQGGTTIGE
jgi:RHS repeat-associated protein